MLVKTYELTETASERLDIIDLTDKVRGALESSGIQNGIAVVFTPGSTAAITAIEYEDGVLEDLAAAIERLAPENIPYRHNLRWGDGNGYSHVRAALAGPSQSFPVVNGHLILGTWQQIVLLDFDNRPRRRRVVVQIMGEDVS